MIPVPDAELEVGAVFAVGVTLETKEKPEKGLIVAADDEEVTAMVDWLADPKDVVALGLAAMGNPGREEEVVATRVDCDEE
jgi:hypothetical protein